jgi:hypothetical protein
MLFSYLFCCHNLHKIGNYFIFEPEQEKLAPLTKISSIHNLKIVTKLSRNVGPGSEKSLSPILFQ